MIDSSPPCQRGPGGEAVHSITTIVQYFSEGRVKVT